jgi:hypothetical protein
MIIAEKKDSQKISNKILGNKIYINTLIPDFKFKNKLGRIIKPINRCITL